MRKFIVLSVAAFAVALSAVGVFGVSSAMADSHDTAVAGIKGRGTVATPDSDLARGFRFGLKAKVNEDGSARGYYTARVHLRGHDGIVTVIGRINRGAIEGNEAKLGGKAVVMLANGRWVRDLPLTVAARVEGPGEYFLVMQVGDRELGGKGVSGNIEIFREIPIRTDAVATTADSL